MASASDCNAAIIQQFRATGGRHAGGEWAGTPMILIHHIGAKSGIERVTPLGCLPLGDDSSTVVTSRGVAPASPAWYHNLKANPVIAVEVGTETFTVVAEELDPAARAPGCGRRWSRGSPPSANTRPAPPGRSRYSS